MIEGKALILSTKPFAKEIKWKSWYYTLSTLFLLIAAFYGTALSLLWWQRLICSVFAGLVTIRFFVIYHDHQHHSILNRSKLADVIFTIFGIFVLAPTSIWKRSHDYHHSHNSKLFSASIGSYPIMTKSKFEASSKKDQRIYLAIRHPLTIFFGYITMFMLGMCLSSFLSAKKRHADSLVALIIHILGSACIIYFVGFTDWVFIIFIPFMIACMIGAYLFYAQHNFPGVTFQHNTDWKYEDAALLSSSYMEMNVFLRWVSANIGYHHIHHLNSRIPFYRLPETMEAIPELQHPVKTSFKPKDIIACFKLKVWDPETNKMVGI